MLLECFPLLPLARFYSFVKQDPEMVSYLPKVSQLVWDRVKR